ncbi:LysR substrate-binding domain-containing protein [Pseudaminobacter soli (ex Zhang et al. 2022)]|nr:LysR substrate-binding domain-containing protein [Pseudaminobacter soli]
MLPSPHSLFVFEAAARTLNFKLAAAELNVTQPSVSHAIKALEVYCKVQLFRRGNRGVQLTEAGRELYESVRSSFVRIEQSLSSIAASGMQYVTLAASTSMAAHWLVPQLHDFQQRHPGSKVKIIATDRDVEPDEQIDLTIWLRPANFDRPNCWYICDEIVLPVCSPAYLSSVDRILSVSDLVGHKLIHCFDAFRKRVGWNEWLALAGADSVGLMPNIVFNDYQLAVQAALAGEGIALGWSLTAQLLLERKLLVPAIDKSVRTGNAFFLVGSGNSAKSAESDKLAKWILRNSSNLR